MKSAERFFELARAASDAPDVGSRVAYEDEMDRILGEIEDPGLAALLNIKRRAKAE